MNNLNRIIKPLNLPGVISLHLFPILMAFFTILNIEPKDQRVMMVVLAHPAFTVFNGNYTSNYALMKLPLREYHKMVITSDSNRDQSQFFIAKSLAQKYSMAKDSLHGLQFILTDEATYGDFVKIADLARIEEFLLMANDNNLWLYYVPGRKTTHEEIKLVDL